MRQQLGLHRPLFEQFFVYIGNLARGDLGLSPTTGQPVGKELLLRLPASLELVLPSLLPACAIELPTYFTGLARERRMATLFITHDLALAVDHCDRIVVMHVSHAVESARCTPSMGG